MNKKNEEKEDLAMKELTLAIVRKHNYFITKNKRILKKRKELEKEYPIKIRTLNKALIKELKAEAEQNDRK